MMNTEEKMEGLKARGIVIKSYAPSTVDDRCLFLKIEEPPQ
jgi:hypothetical protein